MRFSNKVHPDPTLLALRQELSAAQGELSQAYRQFNEAVDPELVESSIYQISAVQARCNYLIRAIKERGAPAETAPAAPARAALAEPEGKEGAVWT